MLLVCSFDAVSMQGRISRIKIYPDKNDAVLS